MKSLLTSFAAAALFVAPLAAQSEINQLDSAIDFTSRGFGGNLDGWCCERFSVRNHLGGLDNVDAWRTIMQDQNCASLENFRFVLFNETTAAGYSQPDEGSRIADTGFFASPSGQGTGPCAWIYTNTFTTPLAGSLPGTNAFASDIYVGAWAASNAGWVNDGASSQISIAAAGANPEFPSVGAANNYPPTVPNPITNPDGDAGASYGCNIQPAGTGSVTYPGSWRIWTNRLRTLDLGLTRASAFDTTGSYLDTGCTAGTGPATNPTNPGMAGHFPDVFNSQACTTPRYDNIGISAVDNGIGGSGFVVAAMAGTLSRDVLGAPLAALGGVLELNPTDPLFNFSLADPQFQRPWTAAGTIDIEIDLGPAGSFARINIWLFVQRLYWQALWVDLANGQFILCSLGCQWIICI